MKLNVIVTAYNVGEYITQCVESVLSQITKFEFNVLVRDDGSTDNTREKLLSLSKKYQNILLVLDDNNLGVHKSVEQLISLCDSQYIATLDGDDYFVEKSHLQQQVDFLDDNPNYVMSCCGVKVDRDGELFPIENLYIISAKNPIKQKDLLVQNYVNFGRVFRNIKKILPLPDYCHECYLDDWALNYKLMEFGDTFCLDYLGGVYRIRKEGRFQKFNEKQIEEKNMHDIKILKSADNQSRKVITIIDCFVHNKEIEMLLSSKIDQLKSCGKKVFLISNSNISESIIGKVDYFFSNRENHLFEDKFDEVSPVIFWGVYPRFTIYKVEKGYQKHGLSVLRNIVDALKISKQMGYDYFERLEVDSIYNQKSLEYLNFVPQLCDREDKIGLFYKNEYNGEETNVSFHYFYSKIDEFLELFEPIRSTDDYLKWIEKKYGTKDFKNVEIFIYECLKEYGLEKFLIKHGGNEMNYDFGEINWNTVTSISNLSEKYQGAITKILPMYQKINDREESKDSNIIFSENKKDDIKDRKILYYHDDRLVGELRHTLKHNGHWIYNEVPNYVNKIEVFEDENLLYIDEIKFDGNRLVLHEVHTDNN
jgi:glycosyltransferase involved in cell wall biosynthesis